MLTNLLTVAAIYVSIGLVFAALFVAHATEADYDVLSPPDEWDDDAEEIARNTSRMTGYWVDPRLIPLSFHDWSRRTAAPLTLTLLWFPLILKTNPHKKAVLFWWWPRR